MKNCSLYFNGTIITMEHENSVFEAIYQEDGYIKALGTSKDLLQTYATCENKFDLKGKTLIPGFIDSHSHICSTSSMLLLVNVAPPPNGTCDSKRQLLQILSDTFQKKNYEADDWLVANGYEPSAFANKEEITRKELDQISIKVPICVTHSSGHYAVLNSPALVRMGYLSDIHSSELILGSVPKGGVVETTPGTNNPSGAVKEQAFLSPNKISNIKQPSMEQIILSIKAAAQLYLSNGITSCQDARVQTNDLYLLQTAKDKGYLPLDVTLYITPEASDKILTKEQAVFVPINKVTDRSPSPKIQALGMKSFLDGSPQAKTAYLTKPYYEVPEGKPMDYCGFEILTDEEFTAQCEKCLSNNWQLNVHCNGDAASDQYIRCYQNAMKNLNITESNRPVMVHAQTVREDQLDQMKEMNMLPTFFLDHVYYWGDYHYESVLGPERANRISPAKSCIHRGLSFTLHQDTPVVLPNMIFTLHNAVNRKTRNGRTLGEEQRLTPFEALQALTVNGAYQIFSEAIKGTLTVGKFADYCILNENPLTIEAEKIKDIKVVMTMKAGNVVFEAKDNT